MRWAAWRARAARRLLRRSACGRLCGLAGLPSAPPSDPGEADIGALHMWLLLKSRTARSQGEAEVRWPASIWAARRKSESCTWIPLFQLLAQSNVNVVRRETARLLEADAPQAFDVVHRVICTGADSPASTDSINSAGHLCRQKQVQRADLMARDLRAERRMLSPTPALSSGLSG